MATDLTTLFSGARRRRSAAEPPLRTDRLADSERLVDVFALVGEAVVLNDGAFVRGLEVLPVDLEGGQASQRAAYWARFADALRRCHAPFSLQIIVTTQPQDIRAYLRRVESHVEHWRGLAEQTSDAALAARRRRMAQLAVENLAFLTAMHEQLQPLQQRYLLILRYTPFPLLGQKKLLLDEAHMSEAFEALEDQVLRLRAAFEPLELPLLDLDAVMLCQAVWDHYHRRAGAFDLGQRLRHSNGADSSQRPDAAALHDAARDPARLADLLAPDLVEEQADHVRVGECLARGYVLHDFDPRAPVDAAQVLAFPADMTHAFYLSAADPAEMRRKLKERETELKATSLTAARNGAVTDWGRQAAINELEGGRAVLEVALEAPFLVHWLCLLWARDAHSLERRCQKFESLLQVRGIRYYPATRRHLSLVQSARPLARLDHPVRPRHLSAEALGAFFPFVRREYLDVDGWAFGLHRGNGLLVCADPFKGGQDNASELVIGAPRSGKSLYLKQLVETLLVQGDRVFVVDPEREYVRLAVDLHAAYIELGKQAEPRLFRLPAESPERVSETLADIALLFESLAARPMHTDEMAAVVAAVRPALEADQPAITLPALIAELCELNDSQAREVARVLDYAVRLDGGHGLNILDLNLTSEDAWRSAAQSLAAFVEAAQSRSLEAGEYNALTTAYERTLAKWEFTANDRRGWAARSERMPVLANLAETLAADPAAESQALARTLYQFAFGLYADLFNTRTTVDVSGAQCVVFGLRALRENAEKPLTPVFAWQVLRLVWNEIVALGGAQRAHLIIDEAWYVLEQAGAAKRLEHFVRSFPKYNAALHLATHEIEKWLADPAAAQLAQLARVKLLFGQETERATRMLAEVFGLDPAEAAGLHHARKGEGLLMVGHDLRVPLYVPVNPARLARWATNREQQQAVSRASGRAAQPVV